MSTPTIPSIETIKNRIISDIESKINQTIPALPLSFIKILSSAIAGVIFLNYQICIWVYKQIFPESADYENLVKLGRIVGITPTPEVQAIILCDVPGTTGEYVTQGTLFVGTNNITYRVTTSTEIIAGTASDVPMLALTGGDDGNLADGEELTISQTDLNLTGTATVTGTDTSGADEESDESFAARVSIRYRVRYITGSVGGYTINGLETPNFTWVGVYASDTIESNINVYGRVDNQTDGIPTTAQLTELESYMTYDPTTGKAYRKPPGDILNTLPITLREFELIVYISGSTSELNASIEDALNDYIEGLEPYNLGISDVKKNVLTKGGVTGVADDIANPEGVSIIDVTITDVLTGLPEVNYNLYGGEFAKFSSITFTAVA